MSPLGREPKREAAPPDVDSRGIELRRAVPEEIAPHRDEPQEQTLEEGQPAPTTGGPVSSQVLSVPSEGLEQRPQPKKRVIVVGAGMAGAGARVGPPPR